MRLVARLCGPHALEAQTVRASVFSSQSHEVREASHLQPVPTKIARYRYTGHEGHLYRHNVHSNSVHKSTSSWGVARKLLDSMGPGLPIAASFYRVA